MRTAVTLVVLALAALVAAESPAPDGDSESALDCQPGAELAVRIVNGRVLRARADAEVKVHWCMVEVMQWEHECTTSADDETVLTAHLTKLINTTIVPLGRDRCAQLFSTLKYTTEDGKVLDLALTRESTTEGVVPQCQQPGQIVVQQDTGVRLKTKWVSVLKEGDPIRVPWGEHCAFEKGHCSNASQGDAYWATNLTRYDVLFEGPGKLVETFNDRFFVSSSPVELWGYRLVYATHLHGHSDEAFATDQPRVTLVVGKEGKSSLDNVSRRLPLADQDPEEALRAAATFRSVANELGEYQRRRHQEYAACLRDRLIYQTVQALQAKQAELATQLNEANEALRALSQKARR